MIDFTKVIARSVFWSIFAATTTFAPGAIADPVIGETNISINTVAPNVSTPVLVTSRIFDTSVIPQSIVLQLTNTNGTLTTIGTLHDDGLNGDLSLGDHVYSLQFTVKQAAPTELKYQVSAAFKNTLLRAKSPSFSIFVQKPGTAEAMIAQFATELATGDIDSAVKHFDSNPRDRQRLESLPTEARNILAAGLQAVTLLKTDGATKIYNLPLRKRDGSVIVRTIGVSQAPAGDWYVMFW